VAKSKEIEQPGFDLITAPGDIKKMQAQPKRLTYDEAVAFDAEQRAMAEREVDDEDEAMRQDDADRQKVIAPLSVQPRNLR
jgi:hypothetical protein